MYSTTGKSFPSKALQILNTHLYPNAGYVDERNVDYPTFDTASLGNQPETIYFYLPRHE